MSRAYFPLPAPAPSESPPHRSVGFFVLWFMFMSSLSKSSNCVNICLASCIPSSLSLNRACEAIQSESAESARDSGTKWWWRRRGRRRGRRCSVRRQPFQQPTSPLAQRAHRTLYSGLNFAYKRQRSCECRLCRCTVDRLLCSETSVTLFQSA